MRDSRRIQERMEIRLDRVQVVWITLGCTVAMGLVFALGMALGRRAERASLDAQRLAAAVVADPLAAVEHESKKHDDLAFYTALAKDEPPIAMMRTPVEADADAPSRKRDEEPRAAERKAVASSPAPAAAPHKRARVKPATRSADVSRKLSDGPAEPGQYTVQVSAFQTIDEAKTFAASLERKGFAPFITSAEIPAKGTWYRVRMGSFDNELEATMAKQLLASKDIPAWVLKN